MRFVELTLDADREGFSLNPRVTVMRGLAPMAHVQLVGLVHSVAAAETSDWSGTVEVHGVRMDLDDALATIGATAPAGLVVDGGALPDLAPPDESDHSEEADGHREAVAVRTEIEREISAIANELASAGSVRGEMNARLAAATARVDSAVGARLDRADAALARRALTSDIPDPWSGAADLDERLEILAARAESLRGELAGLHSGDRAALAAAVAVARAALGPTPVIDPRAASLQQRWTGAHRRLALIESRLDAGGLDSETAADRLDRARAAARAAANAAEPRRITEEEAANLAALHDELGELQGRSSRGVRRGSARPQLDEVQRQLDAALGTLGFPTWTAYRMSTGSTEISPEAMAESARCAEELAEIEREVEELNAQLENDDDLRALISEVAGLHDEAKELLGSDPLETSDDPDVVTRALGGLTVEATPDPGALADALAALRVEMDRCGATTDDDVASPAALVALGDSWVEVLDVADIAAVRIERDLERIDGLLAGADGPAPSGDDGLEAARADVRAAEHEVAACRSALVERAQVRLELHVLAATELGMAERHDAKVEEYEAAKVLEDLAAQRSRPGGAPASAGSLGDRVPRGRGGPIPVVVTLGGSDVRLLDSILTLPDDVQILVVGEAEGLDSWIAAAGDAVSVVEAAALV